MSGVILVLLLIIIVFLYMPVRHTPWLPTLPFAYPNSYNEGGGVLRLVRMRSPDQEALFHATDCSVAKAFAPILPDIPFDVLLRKSTEPNPQIIALKILINRPRPWQVRPDIYPHLLQSATAYSPSFPSGHSYQAFYLAKTYSKQYPSLREELYEMAEQCGNARIIAGHHYPSDHEFSRRLVELFH